MSTTTTTKMPTTPEEMLVYLRHHAKGEEDIEKTVFKVKMNQTWDESYKALNEQSREKLAKTFAYLKNLEDAKEEEVAKLSKDGLRVMVLPRLQELMPELCQPCHKTHFYERTETPMVCCVRCNKGACRDCYQSNPGAGRSFYYLCSTCEKFVSTNIGDKALTSNHLLKKPKVSKKKPAAKETLEESTKPEAEEEVEEEEVEEDMSSSCPFVNDVEEEQDKEASKPADVTTSLFPPSAPVLGPEEQEQTTTQDTDIVVAEKLRKCPVCDFTSADETEMKKHIKNVHDNIVLKYFECPKCRFQSTDMQEVRDHMNEKHELVATDNEVEFIKQVPRGFKNKTDDANDQKTKNVDIKNKVCPYLKKGHCNYSLSGRKPFKGVSQCPYLHPRTCPKLLNNGTKGKYRCDGSK